MNQSLNFLLQRIQITRHGFPEDVQIEAEVIMHDDIAHTDDLRPGDVGCIVPYLLWQSTGSLADDLKVSDHPALEQLILIKGITPA